MASEVELAWAAGLFEGEGCVTLFQAFDKRKGRKSMVANAQLSMSDPDVMERFVAIMGFGCVSPQVGVNKPVLVWRANGWAAVERTWELIGKHLCERRTAKFKEAMAAKPDSYRSRKQRQSYCPKGHPYTEDNIYWMSSPSGRKTRTCRICNRESCRRSRARRRARKVGGVA